MMKPTRWIVGVAKIVGSAAALAGFAGAANASATIDLIWADTGTNEISRVPASSEITLQVILTAGPNGARTGDVSVDYSAAIGTLAVVDFSNSARSPLSSTVIDPSDTGSRIEHINGYSLVNSLAAGQSHQLGTVTFHRSATSSGVIEILSDANGGEFSGAILDGAFNNVTATSTFNSAFLISGDPPCNLLIDVNVLRGGSPTVAVNSTKDITAKARVRKGTALPDTTIDTMLRIVAFDGSEIIDSQISGPIQLEVGKGGDGDTLALNVSQCNSGSINFVANFFGTADSGALCEASRRITKTCE